MTVTPTVFVVDDDHAVRDSLALLLESDDLPVETFSSALEFLDGWRDDRPGCLLLDIRMPQMTGLELRDRLDELGAILPVVFITGHGDVPMAVDAMKRGALDFIQKPFRDEDLLARVHQALEQDMAQRARLSDVRRTRELFATLTHREQEVMALVVRGLANKVIAQDLAISQRTVEIHRARVMEKMAAASVAHLVRLANFLE